MMYRMQRRRNKLCSRIPLYPRLEIEIETAPLRLVEVLPPPLAVNAACPTPRESVPAIENVPVGAEIVSATITIMIITYVRE